MSASIARLALVLLGAIALALLFQDFLRETIVVPILYAYWFARLYIESLPQTLLWAIFIVAAVMIVGRSFWAQSGRSSRSLRGVDVKPLGKIGAWSERIHLARQGGYFQERLARSLAELTLATLSYRERISPEEVQKEIQSGLANMPQEILAYVRAGLSLSETQPESLSWDRNVSSLYENPERIVQFLEDELRGLPPTERESL